MSVYIYIYISVREISVWPIRSGRLGLAVSVAGLFGQGRFGLGTFRSDYEILQKYHMLTFNCTHSQIN